MADGWDRLEALYRAEHARMVRLAHLLTGDRSLAEELVHEAFLRVHPHLARIEDPPAYLRTAVVNACRGDGRRRALAQRALPTHVDVVDPPALPREVDEVWQAVQALPPRRRDALILRYYADLPTAEVARLLGARPATARSLIRRGLASLEEVLER